MKIRIGLITLIATLLLSVNAFAVGIGTFDITTDFDNWSTTNPSIDGSALDLSFSGWQAVPNTYIAGGSGSSITFGDGSYWKNASQFAFLYTLANDQYGGLAITLETLSGESLTNPATYISAEDTLGNVLTVSTYANSPNTVYIDLPLFGNLHFYINTGFEQLVSIAELSFMTETGTVLIDEFGYNPVPTPIPAAAWLLGSGLIGLVGMRRRFKA